jgi:phosphohistidine phosphatase
MDLFVIRHGVAAEPSANRPAADRRRPLTVEGKKRMRRVAAGLQRLGTAFDRILTSPLRRAVQTAAILGLCLGVRPGKIVRTDLMLPGADIDDLLDMLRRNHRDETVALVGHEPHLSGLLAKLLTNGGTGSFVEMKKGAAAHVRMEWDGSRPRATLVALLPARALRRI